MHRFACGYCGFVAHDSSTPRRTRATVRPALQAAEALTSGSVPFVEDALLAHERRTQVFFTIKMLRAPMRDYVTCATRSSSAKAPPPRCAADRAVGRPLPRALRPAATSPKRVGECSRLTEGSPGWSTRHPSAEFAAP